jgi:23S rRNA (uracil1939-C5)-methyltransferase
MSALPEACHPCHEISDLAFLLRAVSCGVLLSIEKLVYGGDGLARAPAASDGRSMAVFVPFVLPGERVEAEIEPGKSGFARARVTQLIEASPDRIVARCPYFQNCGGCHYQHIVYEHQLKFKEHILRETLVRVAKIDYAGVIQLHPSPPWNYRNRSRFQVRTESRFAVGYYRFGSKEFLAVQECPIGSPLINRVIARLTELGGGGCPEVVEELELFADAADEHTLGWAFCRRDARPQDLLTWADTLRSALPEIVGLSFFPARGVADEDGPTATMLAQSGEKAIRYRTSQADYEVRAGAFFQVNRYLIDDLVSVVTGGEGGETALDLYAGGGLFTVPLAGKFHHIFAVEASQTSSEDLRQNVPASVKVAGTRTEDYLRNRPVGRPDLVVLDPPRAGAGKAVIQSLVELGARRVCYVSCDPATLARDLAPLLASGYHIKAAHLFDFFPQTFHIESVMLLER